ncbi:MAG TPA: acyltransferase family protein [Chitinophagaceae bacterium]|nr:acyltransferase family protein [Chitinophagaceae bacterium]
MQTINSSRQAYLDWLRILAILGVLFFHSAMPFVAEWQWHIKNKETSNLLLEFNFWLSRFRMPLLFFISGTVSYFMLKNKSAGSFITLRFRRLFIPLIAGTFLIVPPQLYLERLTQGYTGSYINFYDKIFEFKIYPKGNLSWHHLWFIWYLFVYDVVFAPIFKWCLSQKGQLFLQRLNSLAKGKWIYLLIVPSVIVYTSLSLKYPETNDFIHDWCRLFYWLLFLLVGFLCIANPLLMDSLEKNRRTSFAIAFTSLIVINYLRWNHLEPENIHHWTMYAYLSLYPLTAWLWVMTAVGYGKKYLNRKHKILDYINQSVYPFYILHQTVIVIIAYYVVQTTDSILIKYLFTVITSFVLSMTIYHLFIRPYTFTRFLFGMKSKKKISVEKYESRILTNKAIKEVV